MSKKILLYTFLTIYFFIIFIFFLIYKFPLNRVKNWIEYKCSYPPFFYFKVSNISFNNISSFKLNKVTLIYNSKRFYKYSLNEIKINPLFIKTLFNGPCGAIEVIKDKKLVFYGKIYGSFWNNYFYFKKARFLLTDLDITSFGITPLVYGKLKGEIVCRGMIKDKRMAEEIDVDLMGIRLKKGISFLRHIYGRTHLKGKIWIRNGTIHIEKLVLSFSPGVYISLNGDIDPRIPFYSSILSLRGSFFRKGSIFNFSLEGKGDSIHLKVK